MADVKGLIKALKDMAVTQYGKGAPYRNALASALRGDMSGFQELNKPSPVMPNEALDVAMTFAPMGITKAVGSKMPLTEFEVNHLTAQRNAALPISEGGLGLPVNNTAMDRAKAMGFDTEKTWYHSTPYNFNEFSKTNDIGYHFGDRWQANDRTRMGGGNIIPVHLKTKNTINTNDVYDRDASWQIANEMKNKGIVNEDDLSNLWKENIPARYNEALSDLLKQKGIDSIHYDNTVEGILSSLRDNGEKNISAIVLSPNQIRSKFAAFDPFKRNEADILAGVGAGLPISSKLFNTEDKKKK